jgi:hypothetical protein
MLYAVESMHRENEAYIKDFEFKQQHFEANERLKEQEEEELRIKKTRRFERRKSTEEVRL